MTKERVNRIFVFLTLVGISTFILFFVIAASHYPGGSNFDPSSIGYSWKENFWCELLGHSAKNSMPNAARPYALTGMIGLSIGVSSFWYLITQGLFPNKALNLVTRAFGIISMFLSSFIFTIYHDLFIFGSVITGSFAFFLLFRQFWQRSQYLFFISGMTFMIMILANCFIYLTDIGETVLPSLQKLTFLYTLFWIVYMSINHKKIRHES
jgi:hypothetical protein